MPGMEQCDKHVAFMAASKAVCGGSTTTLPDNVGYRAIAEPTAFVVAGKFGPLLPSHWIME